MTDEKVLENRLRRIATRRGMILKKSPRRDPEARDYGLYALIDRDTNALLTGQNSAFPATANAALVRFRVRSSSFT